MLEIVQQNSDLILSTCSLVFSASLVPTVVYNENHKVCEIPYATSIPTAVFMALVVLVYVSNGFVMSSMIGGVATSMWIAIAVQRFTYNR